MTEENQTEKKWIDAIYMLHENELWLNEQAQKGLLLKSFDKKYADFTEGDADNRNYKIVVLNKDQAQNQVKIIEHQGFTFVANNKEYYIFYINERYGHINPRLNEEMAQYVTKWFNKRFFNMFIGLLVGIAFIVTLGMFLFFKGLLASAIVELPIRSYIIGGIVFAIIAICGIREYLVLVKSKKCFLEHNGYIANRSFIDSKIIRTIFVMWFWVSLILPICTGYLDYNKYIEIASISEVYEKMPTVLIQDIEQQEVLSGKLLDTQKDINDDNYAELDSTLMAPKQYRARQEYEFQDKTNIRMRTRYYEVVSKPIAKLLAKEIIIDEVSIKYKDDIKENKIRGLDNVYTYQGVNIIGEDVIYVSVSKGKRVMLVEYYGEQPVEKILNEIAEVL